MFLLQNIDIDYSNVAVHHCQAPNIIIIFRYWGYNVNYVVTTMLCDRTNKNRTQHFPTHSGSHITIVISGVVGTNTRTHEQYTRHGAAACESWSWPARAAPPWVPSAQFRNTPPVSTSSSPGPHWAYRSYIWRYQRNFAVILQYLVLLPRHLSTKLSILLSSFKGLL